MPLGAVRHTGEAAIVLCQVPEGRQTVDERRDIIPVKVAKLFNAVGLEFFHPVAQRLSAGLQRSRALGQALGAVIERLGACLEAGTASGRLTDALRQTLGTSVQTGRASLQCTCCLLYTSRCV